VVNIIVSGRKLLDRRAVGAIEGSQYSDDRAQYVRSTGETESVLVYVDPLSELTAGLPRRNRR